MLVSSDIFKLRHHGDEPADSDPLALAQALAVRRLCAEQVPELVEGSKSCCVELEEAYSVAARCSAGG
jgi:hypothetical protein